MFIDDMRNRFLPQSPALKSDKLSEFIPILHCCALSTRRYSQKGGSVDKTPAAIIIINF